MGKINSKTLKIGLAIASCLGVFFGSFTFAYALSTFATVQGGTGTTTPSGILYGDNGATNHLNTVIIGSGCTFTGGTLSCPGTGGTFSYPFPSNATSTLLDFSGGIQVASLSGFIGGNAGNLYQIASSSLDLPNTALQNPSITVNGTTFNLGDTHTIFAASSTLLANNNTFSGNNTFSNSISGSITGSAGSVANSVTFNSSGSGGSSPQVFNGSGAETISYNTIGAQVAGSYDAVITATTPIIRTANNLAFVGLATTSQPSINNLLTSNGGAGVYGTATSTLTPTAPLGGSLTVIGTGNSLTCTGCLTANQSITLSGVVTGSGATAITTAFGSQTAGVLGNAATGNTAPMATSTLYGAAQNGTVLGYANGLLVPLATTTFSSGLTYASGNVTNTGVTSNVAGTGIGVSGATGAVTISNTGVTSIVAGTNITISGATGAVTINSTGGSGSGLATSSPIASSNLLEYSASGAGSAFGVATSTLTPSSPLTGSFTQIGSSGTLGCQTASGSQAGCLSSTDWTTFNNKGSGTLTAVTGTWPILATTGNTPVISWGGLATSSAISAAGANVLIATGVNTFSSIATSSETCSTGVSCTAFNHIGSGGAITLAALGSAGVLGAPTATTPTVQATSTLYGNGTGGQVLGWSNVTNGLAFVATSTGGGSGTVTSVGLSLPTGLTVTNSPVTTSGTLTATFGVGYGIKKPLTWVVSASGGDFTTIQGALDACGSAGGGSIFLPDPLYSIGGTGLLWKGSNCSIYGTNMGTTTISMTGATTMFKTNTPSAGYSYDELHNLKLVGDSNTSSVLINASDMTHFTADHISANGYGTGIVLNDTQNTTFYNSFTNLDLNDAHAGGWCINASSTNPVNFNYFENIFCGGGSNSGGILADNGNLNTFDHISIEPANTTGTYGVYLFDQNMTTSGGFYHNTFRDMYIEGNRVGYYLGSYAGGVNSGGVIENDFDNPHTESNTFDYLFAATSTALARNTITNALDSNFDFTMTTVTAPFGIGTSTRLASKTATIPSYFDIQGNSAYGFASLVRIYNTAGTALLNILDSGTATAKGVWDFTTANLRLPYAAAPTVSTNGDVGIDSTQNQLKYQSNAATQVLQPNTEASFTFSTTTAWTASTTIQLGPAFYAQTWGAVKCYTDTGTLNVQFINGASNMNMFNASTTIGTLTLSTNNDISAGSKRSVQIGTPASSPTTISCTVSKTVDAQ